MFSFPLALAVAGMAFVPGGSYVPLYTMKGMERVSVSRFAIDREPVTRGEFLDFVRKYPEWRRSAVRSSMADRGYLADWTGDLSIGSTSELRRPVTSVSRNAALAYCSSKGKRLPTVDEWEYTAAASETKRDAARDRSFISRVLGLYTSRSSSPGSVGNGFRNTYGVRDMHELVWEWTSDSEKALDHKHHMFCASSAIGAPDPSNYPAFMRYALRSGLQSRTTLKTLGFRCAADISPA
jgi:formylglycine-generating enzyme required for sulfatase activity